MVNSGVRVLDAMTLRPVSAPPTMCIRNVAAIMERYDVGSVLIQRGQELMGIVTESDFVRRAMLDGHDINNTPVSAIMTRDMVTVSPGMDVFDALTLMKDADVQHLPVVDDGKLVGFITLKDILKVQPHLFDNIVDMWQLREEHRKPLGRAVHPEIEEDDS